MLNNLVILILGMVFLIKGADLFVESSSNIARILRIPSFIIGLTIVSLGTSAPELAVSITASIRKASSLSFGNVIGSNIFNILIVLGVSSFFAPIIIRKEDMKFEIFFLILISVLLAVFGYILTAFRLDRFEGIIFLVLFVIFMTVMIVKSVISNKKKKENTQIEEEKKEEIISLTKGQKFGKIIEDIIFLSLGLVGIIFGGNFVTDSASSIAVELGMSELLVGLTITSIGTSLPELITSVVAAKKKENDIALGNVMGSNIANIILILGTAVTINPIKLGSNSIFDLVLLVVLSFWLLYFIFKAGKINKKDGIAFLILYAIYLMYIIQNA